MNEATKTELRKSILAKRMALSPEAAHEMSQRIQGSILNHQIFTKAPNIGLYSAVKNEVDTTLIFMTALERGFSVYFPRVEQGLQFYEVRDPTDLQKGAWGILEPKDGCQILPVDQQLDLMLIPGVVFDQTGHRIGYGKGFYDVILSKYSGLTAALAYDFQIIEKLPADSWDCKVQRIFTEVKEYLPS